MKAISIPLLLALAASAAPAAGATASASASARIIRPTSMSVQLPSSLTPGRQRSHDVRFLTSRPVAISWGVHFDERAMGTVETTLAREIGSDGGIVVTQRMSVEMSETVDASGAALEPVNAAHLLVTAHTN
jgi:hypothetical protein